MSNEWRTKGRVSRTELQALLAVANTSSEYERFSWPATKLKQIIFIEFHTHGSFKETHKFGLPRD
jgi:uncharacterized protein CbrC (UPF0167 family)